MIVIIIEDCHEPSENGDMATISLKKIKSTTIIKRFPFSHLTVHFYSVYGSKPVKGKLVYNAFWNLPQNIHLL